MLATSGKVFELVLPHDTGLYNIVALLLAAAPFSLLCCNVHYINNKSALNVYNTIRVQRYRYRVLPHTTGTAPSNCSIVVVKYPLRRAHHGS
jgi:hypothetical protein